MSDVNKTQAQNRGRIHTAPDLARAGARRKNEIRNMKLGTLNIATLNGKEEELVQTMIDKKWEIMGLGETRYKGEGCKQIHGDYSIYYKGKEKDTRHGVAIIVNEELSKFIEKTYYVSERIIGIRLNMNKVRMGIIQIYAPQQGRPAEEKDRFYEELQDTFDAMNCVENTVIMGDFNGHIGTNREGIEKVIGAFSVGDKNEDGERIIDFCVRNNLTIMNTCFKHRESHKWTWYRWDANQGKYTTMSMIDLILTSNKSSINDVKAIPSLSMDGDHRMVVCKLKVVKTKKVKTTKKKRYMLENLNCEETKEAYKEKLKSNLEANREESLDEESTEIRWQRLKEAINKAAEETIGVKFVGGKMKKCTPWWTEEVKLAVKTKMQKFRSFMKKKTPERREQYKEACREAESSKREAKRNVWVELGEKLEADYGGGRKLLYGIAKRYRKGNREETKTIKDKNGELLIAVEDIEDRWREYFEDLLNVAGREEIIKEQDVESETDTHEEDEITEEEVIKELKKMKNGKSPGIDGLTADLLKEGGGEVITEITTLFNSVYKTGVVPEDWGKAVICPIFKGGDIKEDKSKGDRKNCKNYRGISLLPHIVKLYEKVIEKRLRSCVESELGEWQYGFRPNRSTMDLIFTLKILMEKSWEFNLKQYMAFLDLEKAFDRVPRSRMWAVLEREEYKVPKSLLKAIKALYSTCESRVQEGSWFKVGCGVRQGSALSPLLFIIYMDRVVKDIAADNIETLSYADDVALVAESEELLQACVNEWCRQLEKYEMKMNVTKSEVMVLSRGEGSCNITATGGQKLKEVNSFKYLGVNFNDSGIMEKEIDVRLTKYSKNVGLLYPLLKEREIPQKVKVTIYKTVLRPILTYGCEAWVLIKRLRSKIQAAEMRVLRLILGITLRDRIRNEVVREKLEVESILDFIERCQLRWYGHVMRMEETRYPKKYLDWQPSGKRPRGRPRMRWIQNIGDAVRRRNTTFDQLEEEERYKDRAWWRGFLYLDSVQLTGATPNRRRM